MLQTSATSAAASKGCQASGLKRKVLVWLRVSDEGGRWIILLFAVTWAADIFAYLVGNLFGGPKLWPRFSPNKTWSGFIGGLIGGTVVAMTIVAFVARWPIMGQDM